MNFLFLYFFLLSTSYKAFTKEFPTDFAWGVSSSAYQTEGAWNEDGKGMSWHDYYWLTEKVPLNQTGFIADDFYHRYREDISLMRRFGIKHFRMSISWARVLPKGTIDEPNPAGIEFYRNVFQTLLDAGITPWVTIFHQDLPQALNDKTSTGGLLDPNFPDIFNDYADFCFKTYGDKIKNWITINEPRVSASQGYAEGRLPPYRCSPENNPICSRIGRGGNSSTEPYIVGKHLILAHGKAVQNYRKNYKDRQGGQIGWTINLNYALPFDPENPKDIKATENYLDFHAGWFLDPLVNGDYPKIMYEDITGGRLPAFTEDEVQIFKGTYDFIGINHYSTFYIKDSTDSKMDWERDMGIIRLSSDKTGKEIGPIAESFWIHAYPPGLRKILDWVHRKYGQPLMYVFENGFDIKGESLLPVKKALTDYQRMELLNEYIDQTVKAVTEDGINLGGYFVWSFMDNYEGGNYLCKFGLIYVDFEKNLTRIPKASAFWYMEKSIQIDWWARGKGDYPNHSMKDFERFANMASLRRRIAHPRKATKGTQTFLGKELEKLWEVEF